MSLFMYEVTKGSVQSVFGVWSKFEMKRWLYIVSKLLDIVPIRVLKEKKSGRSSSKGVWLKLECRVFACFVVMNAFCVVQVVCFVKVQISELI